MQVVPLRRIAPALIVVCGLHALLLWEAAMRTFQVDAELPSAPVMATRWIEAPRVQPPAMERAPAVVPRRASVPQGPRPAEPVNEAPVTAVASPAAEVPIAPTSEPALRIDGIDRAVREAARLPGLAVQSDALLEARPASASQRLERGVASAGKADCLGPERGMALGLFALPMMAIDAVTGRCK